MAYVSIPKDLNAVKTKVMFNLTKRQIICFSMAGITGIPAFLILRNYIDNSLSMFVMIAIMSPFFLLAMYEKYGQPLEVIAKQIYMVKCGKAQKRPYRTKNIYDLLERQYELNKEMTLFVKRKEKEKRKQRGKPKEKQSKK